MNRYPEIKQDNNYQCDRCEVLIQSDRLPTPIGCPRWSFHNWRNLGAVGSTNYQCKQCGTLVKSELTPSYSGCPRGGFHQWNKLDGIILLPE